MVKNKMCIEFRDFSRADLNERFCCLFNTLFPRSILVLQLQEMSPVDESSWHDVFSVDFGSTSTCFEMWSFFGGISFVIFENDSSISWSIFAESSSVSLKSAVTSLYSWFLCWNICKALGCTCTLVTTTCNIRILKTDETPNNYARRNNRI